MRDMFLDVADFCVNSYGSELIMDDDGDIVGFICPECGELILYEDWSDKETENWTMCPICENFFGEEEE